MRIQCQNKSVTLKCSFFLYNKLANKPNFQKLLVYSQIKCSNIFKCFLYINYIKRWWIRENASMRNETKEQFCSRQFSWQYNNLPSYPSVCLWTHLDSICARICSHGPRWEKNYFQDWPCDRTIMQSTVSELPSCSYFYGSSCSGLQIKNDDHFVDATLMPLLLGTNRKWIEGPRNQNALRLF